MYTHMYIYIYIYTHICLAKTHRNIPLSVWLWCLFPSSALAPPPPLSTCFLHALWLCLLCQLVWQTTVAYPFCQGTKPLSIVACPFCQGTKPSSIVACPFCQGKTPKLPASVVHCGHHTLLSRMFFTLLCHHNLLPR